MFCESRLWTPKRPVCYPNRRRLETRYGLTMPCIIFNASHATGESPSYQALSSRFIRIIRV